MTAVVTLLLIVLVSMIVSRVASTVLIATGMSRQYARFQARSAFSGVGYTTSEAESVTNHPLRRRVVMILMLLGNAGIASVVVTLVLGFQGTTTSESLQRALVLAAGLMVIWFIAASPRVESLLGRLLAWFLGGKGLELHDYAGILRIGRDYSIGELHVREDEWLSGRSLRRLALRDEGVTVLGIERDGRYLGSPDGDTVIETGDNLVLYGRSEALRQLDDRRKTMGGELDHIDQVVEQRRRTEEER